MKSSGEEEEKGNQCKRDLSDGAKMDLALCLPQNEQRLVLCAVMTIMNVRIVGSNTTHPSTHPSISPIHPIPLGSAYHSQLLGTPRKNTKSDHRCGHDRWRDL